MTTDEAIQLTKRYLAGDVVSLRPVDAHEYRKVCLSALRAQQEREKGCEKCNRETCCTCRWFGWYPEMCAKCNAQDQYSPTKFCRDCGRLLTEN